MTNAPPNGPVIFDLDAEQEPAPDVSEAPPIPDLDAQGPSTTSAVQIAAQKVAEARPSALARWVWSLLAGLLSTVVTLAAWDYATGLVVRMPILGYAVSAVLLALLLCAVIFALRELAALGRLRRVDRLQAQVAAARSADLHGAQAQASQIMQFYRGRKDLEWASRSFEEKQADILDADALLDLVEVTLMRPLDARAQAEVEAAARQVATVTALVPLALADVITALVSSLRMIRRIAEIYGGRSGFFSSWRLIRAVLAHLVATGAVAVGDDFLEPLLGGSVLSKLSRRFGEGLVNGALTARVGLAAMEVCRPMAFVAEPKPSTRKVVQRALAGILSRAPKE